MKSSREQFKELIEESGTQLDAYRIDIRKLQRREGSFD